MYTIHEAHVGYGHLGTDGRLGYDQSCMFGGGQERVTAQSDLDGWQFVSAHAPSHVIVSFTEAVELVGFLNCTANYDPTNPVSFWADWNYVGSATYPGTPTRPLYLSSGKHELRIFHSRDCGGRHTVWAFRTITSKRSPLAVVTVAQFPAASMVQQIQVLAMSARKQDVPIVVCGENEQFTTYTEAKIRRLCHWVTSLPSECKYILYADNDVGIVGNAEEILSRFLASQTPVLIGCERCCCPVCNSRAWIESFPEKTAGRNFVCAGCWMGTRSAVEYTLQALLNLHERLSRRAEEPSERTEDSPFRHACHRDNDQFLWQALYKLGLAEIALDDSFSLVANVTCENNRWHDPACAFRFQDGRLVDTESGNRPSAIHFSGGSRAFAHQWMGRLGATE